MTDEEVAPARGRPQPGRVRGGLSRPARRRRRARAAARSRSRARPARSSSSRRSRRRWAGCSPCAGGPPRPRSCSTAPVEAARLTGSPHAVAWVLFARTIANVDRGDLDAALADGEESVELCRELDERSIVRCFSHATYGLALAEAGEPERGLQVGRRRHRRPAAPARSPPCRGRSSSAGSSRRSWRSGAAPKPSDAAAEAEAAAAATGLRFGARGGAPRAGGGRSSTAATRPPRPSWRSRRRP